MKNGLLEFWNEAPLSQAPFKHPRDAIPSTRIQPAITSYSQYISAFEQGALPRKALHLGLLPQPYLGDLDNADVILLLRNPGLSACDYHAEWMYPEYRDDLVASIRQEKRHHFFLDTKWAWTTGFTWWEGKLRDVAREIASARFSGHYGRALADLARRVVSLELLPYHSFDFGGVNQLASTDAARSFIAAVDGDRTIIATRGVSDWGLPDATNVIKYPSKLARSASLGISSPGGRAILACYGITVPS